jgi:hypothetical protein
LSSCVGCEPLHSAEALSGPPELPPPGRPRAGRSGAGSLDPVALARRVDPAVRTGTLIDASLVAADCRRPRQGEDRNDPDATWNAMPEKPLFGYKMHLAVDQGSGLVRHAILIPVKVSDGWWYCRELTERGIGDGIVRSAARRVRLTAADHARGRSGRRSRQLRDHETLVRLPRPPSQPGAQRAPAAAAGARPEPARALALTA